MRTRYGWRDTFFFLFAFLVLYHAHNKVRATVALASYAPDAPSSLGCRMARQAAGMSAIFITIGTKNTPVLRAIRS